MLDFIQLENLLVFDIETVPQYAAYDEVPGDFKKMWEHKVRKGLKESDEPVERYYERAGIYAEFGKVVCISAGFFRKAENGQLSFKVKSFASEHEKELLLEFRELLDRHYNDPQKQGLCGHNIREFDVPYLCRRMLVNGIMLPALLDLSGKKPWEINHVDTMQLWGYVA